MTNFLAKVKSNLNIKLSLLVPYTIIAVLFIIFPLIIIIIKSFTSVGDGFNNWSVVAEFSTWEIMWRSIKLGLITALICLLIGLPYTYFIATSKSAIFRVYGLSLIVSPLVIFTIAKALSLKGLVGLAVGVDNINNESFMVLGLVFLNLPFIIIPLYTIFRDMPKNIIEASQDLGYNKLQTLIKVVLPYGMKGIFSGISLVFLMSASSVVISDKLLENGSQLQLIGNTINNFANPISTHDIAIASTLVVVTTICLIGVYALLYFFPAIIQKMKGIKNV